MQKNDETLIIKELSEEEKKIWFESLKRHGKLLALADTVPSMIVDGRQLIKEFYELICEEVKKSRTRLVSDTSESDKLRYSGRTDGLKQMKQAYEVVFEDFLDLPQIDSKTRKNIDKIMEDLRNGKNKN